MKQIFIIGGGPAGISAAQGLAKNLSIEEASITLFEKRDFFFHSPGSLRGMVDSSFIPKILIPYDNAFKGYKNVKIKFVNVESIEYDSRTITFTDMSPPSLKEQREEINYDYLILATGSSYPNPIKPAKVITRRKDIMQDMTKTVEKIKISDRILIVGGGAVGIEMAGELKTYYPNKHIMLLDSHDELLSNQNVPKLRGPVKKALLKLGVELFLGQRLKGERFTSHQFETKSLETEAGTTIESDARIVCVGMKPNIDLMDDPECIVNERTIKVKATMEVDSLDDKYKNVFVLGDASNHPTPKLAYWAMEQGKHIANSITVNIRKGSAVKPYLAPSTEALLLSLGPNGGKTHLPMGKGIVVGNFITKKLKSKDLMSGFFWKILNQKMQ